MSREFELPLLLEDLGMYFLIGKKDNFALYFLRAENTNQERDIHEENLLYQGYPTYHLALNVPIATKVVCFSRLLKC